MKIIKFITVLTVTLLVGISFTNCDDNMYKPEDLVKVQGIVLNEDYIDGREAVIGQAFSIAGLVTVSPVEASYKAENFTSSNPAVATVDGTGNVVPKSLGTSVLTITVEGHSVQFTLTVISRIDYDVTDIEFTEDVLELDVDEKFDLSGKMRLKPVEAEALDVTFSSSNMSVATIDESGSLTCIGAGEVVITATSKADNSIFDDIKIKVFAIDPGFTIENGKVTKYEGPGGNIRIPGTATIVGAGVFKKNNLVTSVHLNRIVTIENEGFKEMANLTKVVAPNLQSQKNSVFQDCIKLEVIDMPVVNDLMQFDFSGTAIKEINMPALVKITDRKRQFANCKELVSVRMENLEILGADEVFFGCDKLKTVYMPKLRTFNEGTNTGTGVNSFQNCIALEEISLPSITILKNNTFAGCTALKKLDLWEAAGLTTVAASAVPDQVGLTIYVATSAIGSKFTGSNYVVTVGAP